MIPRNIDPLLIEAAVEVERLCHGGPPGPACEVNLDCWGALYPDGTEAWADDHLFPRWSCSEGERLARHVLKWLGGEE